jgi:hypothetical protein
VTLFAHYDTDYTGHRSDLAAAVAAVERVDAFLAALADALPDDAFLVISSDHGNLEDTRAGHTLNPVPVLAIGAGREAFAEVRSITDVAPAILTVLGCDKPVRSRRMPIQWTQMICRPISARSAPSGRCAAGNTRRAPSTGQRDKDLSAASRQAGKLRLTCRFR